MEIAIGTGGLKNKFDDEYWDIFTSAIENGSFIHTALNYENIEQYFQKAHEEGIKITKTIIKIEINANPLKKILNISKQINQILEKFKLEHIETIQICNNPNNNFLNQKFLKSIFENFKKKGILKNFVFESFEPFSQNLNKSINDSFYMGYIFTLNLLQRGVTKKFLENIIKSNKKIISISPLAGGKLEKIFLNFDINFKNQIDQIMRENNYEDYNTLSIAFLKAIKNNEISIFGTKNKNRYIYLQNQIKKTKAVNDEFLYRIIDLQDKFKTKIQF